MYGVIQRKKGIANGVTGTDDVSVGKDVNEVGHDIVQQALIMRDDQHGTPAVPQRVDTVGHNFERVDIQTGICLVKNRKIGKKEEKKEKRSGPDAARG